MEESKQERERESGGTGLSKAEMGEATTPFLHSLVSQLH